MQARVAKQSNESPATQTRSGALARTLPLQAKSRASGVAHRPKDMEEEQAGKLSRQGGNFGDVPVFSQQHSISQDQGGNPLPGQLRQKMESAFGADFSDVRVHQGPSADSLGALAFTEGRDIHFAPGQYNPASAEGQRIIAHELTHVVQQRQGRVAMPSGGGVPLNEDASLESEADALGARAVQGGSVTVPQDSSEAGSSEERGDATPIQGMLSRAAVGLAGAGLWMGRNYHQQRRALEDEESVDPSSRLGAMLATRNFQSGTVGYGAHAGIRGIHLAMGNIGQSNIGDLFGSEEAQRVMSEPIDSPANRQLGEMEHGFWQQRYEGEGANGPSTMGERFGGFAGSSFSPETRAQIQEQMSDLRDRF